MILFNNYYQVQVTNGFILQNILEGQYASLNNAMLANAEIMFNLDGLQIERQYVI